MLLPVISFLIILAALIVAARGRRRLPPSSASPQLPRPAVTLFDAPDGAANESPDPLIERARLGDLAVLAEAHGDAGYYRGVLDALTDAFERQDNLAALVRHIAKSDRLRGNARLAEWAIARWQAAPDRRSTVDMVRFAAIADDAATYRRAVDLAVEAFKGGRLNVFSADELLALLESHLWVLAPEAQRGGDGFALKQHFADVRRELAAPPPAR